MTTQRRTYWHLEGRGRVPSEYEIVTSKLMPCASKGYAVRSHVVSWIERHQHTGGLVCADWDELADPRATTYASYVELQQQRTIHVQSVLASVGDAPLPAAWIEYVRDVLSPMRYPAHALQMVSSYLGSMAPSGRLAVALALQTADAIRVVQHLAERVALLRREHATIAEGARERWESDPAWQPWRELLEGLLVTYGFEEALIGLNVVVKPAFDALFLSRVAQVAARHGDFSTQQMLTSLAQDAAWQRELTAALVALLKRNDPHNLVRIRELAARFVPAVRHATQISSERLDALTGCDPATATELHAVLDAYFAALGIEGDAPKGDFT